MIYFIVGILVGFVIGVAIMEKLYRNIHNAAMKLKEAVDKHIELEKERIELETEIEQFNEIWERQSQLN